MPHQGFNVATNAQNVRLELSFGASEDTENSPGEAGFKKDGKESGGAAEIKVKCMEANDVG